MVLPIARRILESHGGSLETHAEREDQQRIEDEIEAIYADGDNKWRSCVLVATEGTMAGGDDKNRRRGKRSDSQIVDSRLGNLGGGSHQFDEEWGGDLDDQRHQDTETHCQEEGVTHPSPRLVPEVPAKCPGDEWCGHICQKVEGKEGEAEDRGVDAERCQFGGAQLRHERRVGESEKWIDRQGAQRRNGQAENRLVGPVEESRHPEGFPAASKRPGHSQNLNISHDPQMGRRASHTSRPNWMKRIERPDQVSFG